MPRVLRERNFPDLSFLLLLLRPISEPRKRGTLYLEIEASPSFDFRRLGHTTSVRVRFVAHLIITVQIKGDFLSDLLDTCRCSVYGHRASIVLCIYRLILDCFWGQVGGWVVVEWLGGVSGSVELGE